MLKHYTLRSINLNYYYFYEIQERYINFRVDAFAYNTINPLLVFSTSNDRLSCHAANLLAQENF